jgi:predicted nucleotidyltransferase
MKTRADIFSLLESNRSRLKEFGVREIGIFGSVVRGEQNNSSDVDVLVDLEKHTFNSYMGLLFFLEDLFGSKVDLVMKDAIKPAIRENILSETVYVADI